MALQYKDEIDYMLMEAREYPTPSIFIYLVRIMNRSVISWRVRKDQECLYTMLVIFFILKNKLSSLLRNKFYLRCNGKYQEWTEWSECSRSCQEYGKSGHKYRHRECLDRDGQQQDVSVCWELYGERSMEHAACNDFPCPQPCEVKPFDDSEKFFEIDCSARGYHTSSGVL